MGAISPFGLTSREGCPLCLNSPDITIKHDQSGALATTSYKQIKKILRLKLMLWEEQLKRFWLAQNNSYPRTLKIKKLLIIERDR